MFNLPVALYPPAAILLYAASVVIPQMGIVTAVFSPLVMMLYLAHSDRSVQHDIFLAVLLGGMAFYNHVLAGFFLVSPLFTAVFIRFANRQNLGRSWIPVAGSAFLAFLVMMLVIYGVDSYREGLVNFTSNALKTFIDSAKQMNAPMVQSPYFDYVDNHKTEAATALVLSFPAFNYIYSAFAAFISMRIFAKIKNAPVENFRMPDYVVWWLIGSLAVIFTPFYYGRFIGLNFTLVLMTLYAFQGFEIVLYWMNRLKFLPILKAIIFIFIFSEPPIILILSLVGLFSVWFNFYGKINDEEQKKSE